MTTESEYLQMRIDQLGHDKESILLKAKMSIVEMDNQIAQIQAKIDALSVESK